MILSDPKTHEEWLKARKLGIGGSDAACIIGANKYKSNTQLWREKTGIIEPEDISDKPAVAYGKAAESYIRELFKLDYPEYDIDYHEYRMYANDDYLFIFATLDGEITDTITSEKGVLEIKTTTIQNTNQWDEWDGKIPDSYYAQVLHQLIATGWDFVILRAYIRYYKNSEIHATVRDYRINRSEEIDSINCLISAEVKFWESIKIRKEPARILPEI